MPVRRPRGVRRRFWTVWLFWRVVATLVTLLVAMCLGFALWLYIAAGQRIEAPDWLRNQIISKLHKQLPEVSIDFDELAVVLPTDLSLHLSVDGVSIGLAHGDPIATLDKFDTTLSIRSLLKGMLQPTSIKLAGSGMVIRRQRDGAITISGNVIRGSPQVADNFVELLDELDRVLKRPNFALLKVAEARDLGLRYEDFKADKAWSTDGSILRLSRDRDDFDLTANIQLLGPRGYATEVAASYHGTVNGPQGTFGFNLTDMPSLELVGQSRALGWLSVVDAPLSGALRGSVRPDGTLGPLNAALNIRAGVLRPAETVGAFNFKDATAYFTFEPDEGEMDIKELSINSDWVVASMEGRARLTGSPTDIVSGMLTQLRIQNIILKPTSLYPVPLEVDEFTVTSRLSFDPFRIELGNIGVQAEGRAVEGSGNIEVTDKGWDVSLLASSPSLTPEMIVQFWPRDYKDKIRSWIDEHILSGELQGARFAFIKHPDAKPDVMLDFGFTGAKMLWVKGMPPIINAQGHASLLRNRFTVLATRGAVEARKGGLTDITGTSFVIPDTTIFQGPAEVGLQARGSITSALNLLDAQPFQFLKKVGRTPEMATGKEHTWGTIDFPLKDVLPKNEVKVDLKSTLTDVRSTRLVENKTLVAKRLNFSLAGKTIKLDGTAEVDSVPYDFKWEAGIGPDAGGRSKVTGIVGLSPQYLQAFGIGLPQGMVSGKGQGKLDLDLGPHNTGRFTLTTDLRGLGLNVPQLGWSKSRRKTGKLLLSGTLGKPATIDKLELDAPGLILNGKVSLRPDGGLDMLKASRLKVGDWLDVKADMIGRGRNKIPDIKVLGGRLDLRKARFGAGNAGGAGGGGGSGNKSAPRPIDVALDNVQVTDTIALTRLRTRLQLAGGARGEFTGLVNGLAPVRGWITPDKGRSAVTVVSDNAGAVASAAEIIKKADAGQMKLVLTPATAKGTFNGTLSVNEVSIHQSPALSALLNTLSIVGLINQLAGDGIYFSSVDADFQLTPNQLIITRASAVGASMGISLDGYYFLKTKNINLQGVFSPFYILNSIGQFMTRKGEGLIGFNYTLKGPVASPSVWVNPLSILTPGMFRDIFRRAPPEVVK